MSDETNTEAEVPAEVAAEPGKAGEKAPIALPFTSLGLRVDS